MTEWEGGEELEEADQLIAELEAERNALVAEVERLTADYYRADRKASLALQEAEEHLNEVEQLREMLAEISLPTWSDERVDYVEVQIDEDTYREIRRVQIALIQEGE